MGLDALGVYAAAGSRAVELALTLAETSGARGRIPIAGAAVLRDDSGTLHTVTVGCNGRIPADDGAGYPVDHGETAAIRHVQNLASVDWSRVVFATTLSPCVMCTRTLLHLHGLGLRRLVIAESSTFSGRPELLASLEGMCIVELTDAPAVARMERFARRYPWDWAADIGAVPPARPFLDGHQLPFQPGPVLAALRAQGHDVAVVDRSGSIIAGAADERLAHGQNPVYCAAMLAIGRAGSAVNLREHALVVASDGPVGVHELGWSGVGACELFGPAAVVCAERVMPDLREILERAGVRVFGAA
jgi:cytosine deaminase